jgi:hypothetical protein
MHPSILAACGLVVGVAAHAIWSEYESKPAGAAIHGSATAPPSACAPDPRRMRSEVRQAVRAAVRGDRANPMAEALRARAALTAGPETDENRQARDEKTALIDAAIRAGRWTDDDVAKFRAILPRLSVTDRPNALVDVSQAIDERRFKVEASVPF